jgi:hypothetical protein
MFLPVRLSGAAPAIRSEPVHATESAAGFGGPISIDLLAGMRGSR